MSRRIKKSDRDATYKRIRKQSDKGGRVFLPQSRMRQIRWEEAVLQSKLNRGIMPAVWAVDGVRHEGIVTSEDVSIRHTTCLCGSMTCQSFPTTRLKAPAPEVVVVEPQPVQSDKQALTDWLERNK